MDKKLEEAGLELRRRMFGKAGADDALNNASPFRRRFEEIVTRAMLRRCLEPRAARTTRRAAC